MKNVHLSRFSLFVLAALVSVAGAHQAQAQQANNRPANLSGNKPEALGFSSERLDRLHAVMQQEVDQKQLAGIVTLLARHGKVVEEKTYGKKDLASGAPMTQDTIFRIFSMTKPVTGVAMMILYEEGKWQPLDPISKYIPEFAHLKVFKGVDESGKMILEDPAHPPTMRELMTHTAGFTYGFFGTTLVDKMYMDQQVLAVPIPSGYDRQAGEDSAALPAGNALGLQRRRWISRATSWKNCRASRCPTSCSSTFSGPLGMKDYRLLRSQRKAEPLCHALRTQ